MVILGVCQHPEIGGPVTELLKAPDNFHAVFGYSREHLPMLFDDLFSPANLHEEVADLKQAVQSGHGCSAKLTLRDVNGSDFPCDIVVSKGNKMKDEYTSPSSVDPDGLHRDFLTTMTIQLCSKNANAAVLGTVVDPSLMDPAHPAFEENTRNRIVAQAERRIDENTQKNKELKQKKSTKTTTGTTSTARGVSSASTRIHAAPAPALIPRNNITSSSSTTRLPSSSSTERPLAPPIPSSQPPRAVISTAEMFEASMTAGYYVPVPVPMTMAVAVAVPVGVEECSRRSADLPVVELEPFEEETPHSPEGVNTLDTINTYDSATELRESEAGSVENVSSLGDPETDGHDATSNTMTEDAHVPYQNIY